MQRSSQSLPFLRRRKSEILGRQGFYINKRRLPTFVFPEGKGGLKFRVPVKTPLRSLNPKGTDYIKKWNVVQHELLSLENEARGSKVRKI